MSIFDKLKKKNKIVEQNENQIINEEEKKELENVTKELDNLLDSVNKALHSDDTLAKPSLRKKEKVIEELPKSKKTERSQNFKNNLRKMTTRKN